jgi:hypothetical protein
MFAQYNSNHSIWIQSHMAQNIWLEMDDHSQQDKIILS